MPAGLLRTSCVIVVSLLCACVYAPVRTAPLTAAVADSDTTVLSTLYTEADAALEQGRRALDAWDRGDAATTAAGLAAARKRLDQVARRCAAIAGCAIERVLGAQNVLLAHQAQALTGVAGARAAAATSAAIADTERSPVLAEMPASARSMELLNGRELGKLIEINSPLRAALREWLTWMRPQLLDAHENYQYLRAKMWPAYAEAGLPEALLFGILAKESGGKVHALSSAGAAGPLQFMPATGKRFGLGMEGGFDTRFDPAASTRANVAYLNQQFARLNNDLELVLGAYNGGEGRMGKLSPEGAHRFWDQRVATKLPAETLAYVPMVLAATWLFLHPDEYGLRFLPVDARAGEIELATAMSLNELSICLGQQGNDRGWFRTLRNLNPRWDQNERLPAGARVEAPASAAAAYQASCTSAAVVAHVRSLQDARIPGAINTVRGAGSRTHVVSKGETLSTIARNVGCADIRDIATANSIAAPRYAIREGQILRIPDCRA